MSTDVTKNELAIGNQYAKRLISLIDKATKNIDVMMFDWRWYSNDPFSDISQINHAFVRAARRKVFIRVLTNYISVVEELKAVGINAKCWDASKLMHSKSIIVDNKYVVMGSHNFTNNAMRHNVETSVFLDNEDIAKGLNDYFESLWRS